MEEGDEALDSWRYWTVEGIIMDCWIIWKRNEGSDAQKKKKTSVLGVMEYKLTAFYLHFEILELIISFS